MRVIAHGGMVNLNESHPNLIANALDLRDARTGTLAVAELFDCANRDLDSYFFLFRPACNGSPSPPYSPLIDEAALRRRLLLPPRTMPPSYLHGNPLLDPVASALSSYGGGDMPALLYPPWAANPDGAEFETVFEGRHEYKPFSIDDPVHGIQQWAERMEPFSSLAADPTGRAYDRRHLVTTISHDDLLARGGRHVQFGLPGIAVSRDLLELMRERVRDLYRSGQRHRIPEAIAQWLSLSVTASIVTLALGLASVGWWVWYQGQGFGASELYVLAIVAGFALRVPARCYHSGIYAIRRIYRPPLAMYGRGCDRSRSV